ncbi:ABC transporter permease subunit [Anabaena sp. FACHB-1237]|uniref:ABC transporter permease subunit n=1 Tax=Anabaena sp. FACHB-1237 TaxID=2692769 RepID=UPI0016815295|nr:ABC transporter permease subunit [Anabaena sp. FACHB-1237]MBD2137890.1 ABC transporter permease subunit [Anabaena sp. FACHB-1237]
MNHQKRWWMTISVIICLVVSLLVGGKAFSSQERVLKIATDSTFPPFEFQGNGSQLQGFSIDLMQAVLMASEAINDNINLKLQWQTLPFDGIIPALQAKSIDAAISSITITPERAKTVDFSRPYFKAGLAIAVAKNNQDIQDIKTLENKNIAVQIGTTGAQLAKKIPGAKVRSFDSTPLALQELKNGNVDAVINDAPVTLYAINTGNLQNIKIIKTLITEEFYGIATPKKSPYLDLINQGISKILENGKYQQIYDKWFKDISPTLPETLPFIQEKTPNTSAVIVILSSLPSLFQGVLVTLKLALISIFFGLITGSLIGIFRLSAIKPVGLLARIYIDFFRGTPLLVQLFMIYFGIPAICQQLNFTLSFNPLLAGIIALTLNSAAYIGEIVRAGIQSIDKGQTEAAKSLGLHPIQIMQYIIFPQALRRMIPPLGNEFISLLKDTSLVAVIGYEELFRKGQLIVADNYRAFEIYASIAVIYLFLTIIFSQLFSKLEKWMNPV